MNLALGILAVLALGLLASPIVSVAIDWLSRTSPRVEILQINGNQRLRIRGSRILSLDEALALSDRIQDIARRASRHQDGSDAERPAGSKSNSA